MKSKNERKGKILISGEGSGQAALVSALFSLFFLLGHSIESHKSLFVGMKEFVLHLLGAAAIFAVSWLALLFLYKLFARLNKKECREFKHSFLFFFIAFLICFLPIIIISYPAVFMGDNLSNICQTYPEAGIIDPDYVSQRLLDDGVYLNNHHPLMHTLLVHFCIESGRVLLGSANLGLLFYSLLQSLIMITILAYSFSIIVRETRLPLWLVVIFFFYIVLTPYVRSYLCLITKDSLYGAFFLLFICSLINCFYKKSREKVTCGQWIVWAIAILGNVFLRNDGIWHLLLFFIIWGIADKRKRKIAAVSWLVPLVLFMAYKNLLLPAMKVVPGSTREMLSVPFQQTARYVQYYGDEVTGSERESITGVLDYESLGDIYSPTLSDPVKATYREAASKEDLLKYFESWLGMGLKHPGVYFDAFFANYDLYFYPTDETMYVYNYRWSDVCMDSVSSKMSQLGITFSFPEEIRKYRNKVDYAGDLILKYYPSKLVGIPALYLWLLLIGWGYGKSRKNQPAKAVMAFVLSKYIFYFLGPTNAGYSRYLFPIVIALPLLLSITIFGKNMGEELSDDKKIQ